MRSFCLFISISLIFSLNLEGQNDTKFKPFAVDIDFGPAIQQTRTGGGVIEINPGYTIAGRYRAGIQLAWAGFDENTVNSYILTLDYYFFKSHRFRLLVGGGYGFYTNSYYGFTTTMPPEEKLSYQSTGRMGANLRIGLEWNHLSFRIANHMAPNLYKYEYYNNDPPGISIFKGSYLGLTLGIRIGGGNK